MKMEATFPQGLLIPTKQIFCPGGRTTADSASPQDDKWTLFMQLSTKFMHLSTKHGVALRVTIESLSYGRKSVPFSAAGGGR